MNLAFLGTSAATSYPVVFCYCANCERARTLGGPSLRKRAAAIINDDLLIDLGPDIMSASFMHGHSISTVRYCLQTHSHSDHLDMSHFVTRIPEYAVVNVPRLHFYASTATMKIASRLLENEWASANLFDSKERERMNLEIFQVEPLQSFTAGRYKITAFSASHDPSTESLLYAVESDGRSIFYGTDTTELEEKTWQGFHRKNLQFDIVVLDHTYGLGIFGSDHLNAEQFIATMARMREEGLLTEKARVFATHISHQGNPVHPELVDFANQNGYEIAYDGLVLEI